MIYSEHVPFFLTQGSYNADSEDEEWLNTRRNIQLDDFEHIIEKLETASQTDIIKPKFVYFICLFLIFNNVFKEMLKSYCNDMIQD